MNNNKGAVSIVLVALVVVVIAVAGYFVFRKSGGTSTPSTQSQSQSSNVAGSGGLLGESKFISGDYNCNDLISQAKMEEIVGTKVYPLKDFQDVVATDPSLVRGGSLEENIKKSKKFLKQCIPSESANKNPYSGENIGSVEVSVLCNSNDSTFQTAQRAYNQHKDIGEYTDTQFTEDISGVGKAAFITLTKNKKTGQIVDYGAISFLDSNLGCYVTVDYGGYYGSYTTPQQVIEAMKPEKDITLKLAQEIEKNIK